MATMTVSRSININKPKAEILDYLKDFQNWQDWSPWLILEPEARLNFSDKQSTVGASYDWQGTRIGSGDMKLIGESDNQLDYALTFIKPFKSKAKVKFVVTEQADTSPDTSPDASLVTWTMDSKMPFFMFPFKKMMTTMIAMDYDRGLKMLKSKLETGDVLSKLTLIGKRKQGTLDYVSIACEGEISEMNTVWQKGLDTLFSEIQKQGIEVGSGCFGLYHDMDKSSTLSKFDICVPLSASNPQSTNVSSPLTLGTLEASDTYVVAHKGAYEFIGNAWAMAYSASRADKIKTKRNPMGLEVYLNDPQEVAEKDLETEIVLFCK